MSAEYEQRGGVIHQTGKAFAQRGTAFIPAPRMQTNQASAPGPTAGNGLRSRRSGGTVDAAGLNPAVPKGTWGFESLLRHQISGGHGCSAAGEDAPAALVARLVVRRLGLNAHQRLRHLV